MTLLHHFQFEARTSRVRLASLWLLLAGLGPACSDKSADAGAGPDPAEPGAAEESSAAAVDESGGVAEAPKPATELPALDEATAEADAKAYPCGEDNEPMCPLQRFMKDEVDPASEAEDMAKLAVALHKIEGFAPDVSWNSSDPSWAQLAKDAAAAAESEDSVAVVRACKACHRAFRKRYRAEFRPREL